MATVAIQAKAVKGAVKTEMSLTRQGRMPLNRQTIITRGGFRLKIQNNKTKCDAIKEARHNESFTPCRIGGIKKISTINVHRNR